MAATTPERTNYFYTNYFRLHHRATSAELVVYNLYKADVDVPIIILLLIICIYEKQHWVVKSTVVHHWYNNSYKINYQKFLMNKNIVKQ